MRNRVMLAAGTLAIVPTLLFAQQRPAQQPAQRPAQRPPAAQPAQRPAPAPARPMAAGTAEQQGAWRLGINATGFIARDGALFGIVGDPGFAGAGNAPNRYLPGVLATVGYQVTDNINIGVNGGYGFTAGLTLMQALVGGTYTFSPGNSLSPYIGVSVGGSRYTGSGSGSPTASGIGGYAMGGIRKFVGDNLAVNLEGRVGMESYSSESITPIVGSAGIGLSYYVGGKKILTNIAVNPGTATIAALRATQQFSAVAHDQKGRPMTGKAFSWRSSNPAVATVSNTGLVTAAGDGSATITATSEGVSGSANVMVSRTAATVAVTPTTANLSALGATQQFSATARDPGNSPITGATFTWTSSNPSVATVSPSGLVTAVGNGTATITGSSSGKTATATVTVAQMVATVNVTPATSQLTAAGATSQLAAQALDANGRPVSGKTFTWSSDAAPVATVSNAGLATAVANGVAHVSAAADGKSGSAIVTVVIATRGAPPIELPAVGASMVMRNVNFQANRAVLLPAAMTDLDKVAITIQGTPNSKWEIAGYTSSVGAAARNLRLSQQRADAVKAYLVRKGVPAASLVSVGRGAANPIASNRTAAGRRQNMRVEIKRLQ